MIVALIYSIIDNISKIVSLQSMWTTLRLSASIELRSVPPHYSIQVYQIGDFRAMLMNFARGNGAGEGVVQG